MPPSLRVGEDTVFKDLNFIEKGEIAMSQLNLDFEVMPRSHFEYLGELLKEQGLDDVEISSSNFLAHARKVACAIARHRGSVTVDDVRQQIPSSLWPATPNAWGGIFRGAEWKHVGWARSPFPSNHARSNRVWTLTNQEIKP